MAAVAAVKAAHPQLEICACLGLLNAERQDQVVICQSKSPVAAA